MKSSQPLVGKGEDAPRDARRFEMQGGVGDVSLMIG
jgi:hypothetical protein